MVTMVPPDTINLSWDGGVLQYSETVDVSSLSDEAIDQMIEQTRAGFRALGGDPDEIDITAWDGEEIRIGYTVERTPDQAVAIGAAELLMVLDGLGGDIDRPWHIVKALGPGAEDDL